MRHVFHSPEVISHEDYPQESLEWNFQELLGYLAMQVLLKSAETLLLINSKHL